MAASQMKDLIRTGTTYSRGALLEHGFCEYRTCPLMRKNASDIGRQGVNMSSCGGTCFIVPPRQSPRTASASISAHARNKWCVNMWGERLANVSSWRRVEEMKSIFNVT